MEGVTRKKFDNCDNVFWYYSPKGYVFVDKYGTNYGNVIVSGEKLNSNYILKEDTRYEKDK